MTYDAKETSTYDGNPIYLYRFTKNSINYDYCSAAEDQVIASPAGTFVASSLQHGKIGVGQPVRKDSLDVVFPVSHPFAILLLQRSTQFSPTTVTIWRGHLDDAANEFVVIFKGKVRAAKLMDETAIALECSGFYSAVKLPGLGGVVHPSCRHALYFGGCGLAKSAFEDVGTVTNIVGNVLTIPEASAEADDFYTSGTLEFQGSQTFITAHTGTSITLRAIPASLLTFFQSGTNPVTTIARGCDHSIDICVSKFSNVVNFGGFPYIPDNDPWNSGSIA